MEGTANELGGKLDQESREEEEVLILDILEADSSRNRPEAGEDNNAMSEPDVQKLGNGKVPIRLCAA